MERRAAVLADGVSSGELNSAAAVHVIAHSMGGLHARFLVSKDVRGLAHRISRVICIGTPHLGSPVTTILDRGNPLEQLPHLFPMDSAVLDELCANLDAVHDLSSGVARAFNQRCPDIDQVRYVEVAGRGRAGARCIRPSSSN